MTKSSDILYTEKWTPSFVPFAFFLPVFYSYNVEIDSQNLTFGYGVRSPNWLTSKRVLLTDIEPSSIVTGEATWKDNIREFGGWGIRHMRRSRGSDRGWCYNAAWQGSYVEVTLKNGTFYRFATLDKDRVRTALEEAASAASKSN